jgi:hypothetical protein
VKHLIAPARFSGVPSASLVSDDAAQQGAVPADLAAALSDDKVREMALRPPVYTQGASAVAHLQAA